MKEKSYVTIKNYGKVHQESIKRIQYFDELHLLLTCSRDPNASIVLKNIENKWKTIFYKVPRVSI